MPMEITFELSDDALDYFRRLMLEARRKSADLDRNAIIENARALLKRVRQSETADFIRERTGRLEILIEMVLDDGWGMERQERDRVLEALSYFSEPQDLIPDDVPLLGFLDDAIIIEMVCRELQHEIEAYRDFCVYRSAETSRTEQQAQQAEGSDWLEERRQQLHSRMRRRRSRGSGGHSPFSLF